MSPEILTVLTGIFGALVLLCAGIIGWRIAQQRDHRGAAAPPTPPRSKIAERRAMLQDELARRGDELDQPADNPPSRALRRDHKTRQPPVPTLISIPNLAARPTGASPAKVQSAARDQADSERDR